MIASVNRVVTKVNCEWVNGSMTAGAGPVLTFFANTREVRNPKAELKQMPKMQDPNARRP